LVNLARVREHRARLRPAAYTVHALFVCALEADAVRAKLVGYRARAMPVLREASIVGAASPDTPFARALWSSSTGTDELTS